MNNSLLAGMHALICSFAGAWSKHIIDFNKRGAISEALKSEQVEAEIVAPGPSEYVSPLISCIYKISMKKHRRAYMVVL